MTDQTSKKILPPGREGIRTLAADLRQVLPSNFIWNFSHVLLDLSEANEYIKEKYGRSCGYAGCAMGYAQIFYLNMSKETDLGEYLGMDTGGESGDESGDSPANLIFYTSSKYYPGKAYDDITPVDVANALERYLEETKDQETNQ